MIQSSDLLRKILSNVDIKTATIKECMVTNITYIFIKSTKTPQYINELNHIRNYPLEQYDKFKEGDNIVTIIHAFKILLDQRGKSFLENKWGIKVDEIRKEITDFESAFEKFYNSLDEKVLNEFESYINNLSSISTDSREESMKPLHIRKLYGYNLFIWKIDKEFAFINLYKKHIKQYEELKYKIYNAAIKNEDQYTAELHISSDNRYNNDKNSEFESLLRVTIILNRCFDKSKYKHSKKGIKHLKEVYKEFIQEKDINIILKSINNLPDFTYDLLTDNISKIQSAEAFIPYIIFLCSSSANYIYMIYHILQLVNLECNERCITGRLLYEGYIKWCKVNKINPYFTINKDKLIEYPINAIKTHAGQPHFPKKRFIDNYNNVKREELNKTFLQNLLKGMIDEKIIAPDTNEEHFFFVFGYGEDGFENFKPIKILKPNTNYTRESGKRTIIYLLKELMGYSDDEIRPTLGKNRHLVINSCFEVSPLFKSSDFGDIPASEASEIIKASELLKIKRIFETALNDTKGTIQ